jgi:Xaa-Pro aminopeptidase
MLDAAYAPPALAELEARRAAILGMLDALHPGYTLAAVTGKINQYYLTGTVQEGIFLLRPNGSYGFFVRKSLERALDESPLKNIYPMRSYQEAAAVFGAEAGNLLVEAETLPLAALERLKKYFRFDAVTSMENAFRAVRAVKTPYEIMVMEASGAAHRALMEAVIPGLLREGLSEAEFSAAVFYEMVKLGHHGASRYFRLGAEVAGGQFAFGENSLYPTCFDGPAGHKGLCPASPVLGRRDRFLQKNDLIFADVSFGVNGYHTDKTQVYYFGKEVPDALLRAQDECLDIERRLADMLTPGAIPSEIYRRIYETIPEEKRRNFMGCEKNAVSFLGHGVGLHVDEYPVIAKGFDLPLAENVVMALEPKRALPGIGLVGVEDTYVVTKAGGRCLTGGGKPIIRVEA